MNISILGCGWLGLPLAKNLVEQNHIIKGSTTRAEKLSHLQNVGIVPYHLKLLPEGVQGDLSSFLSEAELLIVNFPPGLRKNPSEDLTAKIGRLRDYIEKSGVEKVIFVSSTSVYEDKEEILVYTEETEPNGTAPASLELRPAENILKSSDYFTTSIVRFGGLIGPGRHPGKYLSGRKEITDPEAPVNLIHLEDCIGIITKIIEKRAWNEIFNAAYPEHPTRREFYTEYARAQGISAPEFDEAEVSKGKVIDSVRIPHVLQYSFRKPIF